MIIDFSAHQFQHEPRAVIRILTRTLAFVLILADLGSAALAAEFSIIPAAQFGSRYDTNPRYLPNSSEAEATLGAIVDAKLPILYRSPTSSVSLNPRVVRSFYTKKKNSDLEDRDWYLTGWASQSFRRSNFGAGYGYTDLSLRTSSFSEGGSGGILLINDDNQKTWFVQPSWQYQVSQANSVSLSGGYSDVTYDEERLTRRFDYDFSNASATFQHAFNDRHILELQANFSKYGSRNDSLSVTNDSKSNGLNLIYMYSWSSNSSVSANVGWARTKGKVSRPNDFNPVTGELFCNPDIIQIFPCETRSDVTNFVGNMSISHKTESVQYRLLFGQGLSPDSNGAQVLRFNIDASAKKSFTERLIGFLRISGYTQSNVGASQFDFGNDFYRADLRLDYKLTRKWSLYSLYFYSESRQDRVLNKTSAHNNYLSIGLSFQGDGWHW